MMLSVDNDSLQPAVFHLNICALFVLLIIPLFVVITVAYRLVSKKIIIMSDNIIGVDNFSGFVDQRFAKVEKIFR
jgi:hypothetical protein